MDTTVSRILSHEFKTMLSMRSSCPSFWVTELSVQDMIVRKKILRSAISSLKSSNLRLRLNAKTTKVLNRLHELSKKMEGDDESAFRRPGYEILVTSKQRLFVREDEEISVRLNDRRSLGSKLVLLNLQPHATEEDIVPVLERYGTLISVRMPLNPRTKQNRGHAFVTFSRMEEAALVVQRFRNSHLRGLLTEPSRRLFVRHIPRNKEPLEVQRRLHQMLPGLVKITMFPIAASLTRVRSDMRNVGYAFLEFQTSHYAKLAKTIISVIQILGSELAADWADPMNPEYHICSIRGDVA